MKYYTKYRIMQKVTAPTQRTGLYPKGTPFMGVIIGFQTAIAPPYTRSPENDLSAFCSTLYHVWSPNYSGWYPESALREVFNITDKRHPIQIQKGLKHGSKAGGTKEKSDARVNRPRRTDKRAPAKNRPNVRRA